MEGGRWRLIGAHERIDGRFRNGVAEGFPDSPPDGQVTMWHANGRKSGEVRFLAGRPEGVFRGWHENGRLAVEGRIERCQVKRMTLWDDDGRRRFVASEDALIGYDENGLQRDYSTDEIFNILGRNAFHFWVMSARRATCRE
ncbi:MAG: hypothetical protein HY294_07025 [Candidatus Rokubacteria bacterium]|nr:hypothetical protein [Candidatus Rokubacteria bacterium]